MAHCIFPPGAACASSNVVVVGQLGTTSELVRLSTDERVSCILSNWCSFCDCSDLRESKLYSSTSCLLFFVNSAVLSSFRSWALSWGLSPPHWVSSLLLQLRLLPSVLGLFRLFLTFVLISKLCPLSGNPLIACVFLAFFVVWPSVLFGALFAEPVRTRVLWYCFGPYTVDQLPALPFCFHLPWLHYYYLLFACFVAKCSTSITTCCLLLRCL
jgi:hypothetical protein